MDPETAGSEIAYPSADVLAKGTAFMYQAQETSQYVDSLWLDVKTQGSNNTVAIVCIAVVAVAVAAYFIIHNARKKKRIANRGKGGSKK